MNFETMNTENAGDEAHHLLLDQAQHFRGVVNVPELDLLDPGRVTLLQQGHVFVVLQGDDPVRRLKVFHRHLDWGAASLSEGTQATSFQGFYGRHRHRADVVHASLQSQAP
jgi:hypothetical protein